MIQTEPIQIDWEGGGAALRLMRHDGSAWGRVTPNDPALPEVDLVGYDEQQLAMDLYDWPDSDALQWLSERLWVGPIVIQTAQGWLSREATQSGSVK